MKLHREGNIIVGLSFTAFLVLSILCFYLFNSIVFYGLASAFFALFLLILQFFRVPHRSINAEPGQVICPADGKVVVIEEVFESEFLQEKCWQISIFMSPLNVHANYYPIDGKVIYTQYHPGKYLVAWHPKSSTENERSTTVIETEQGKRVLVRQIAGAMARRICFYAKTAMKSTRGAELGFIKFGSRVDVFLPLGSKIHVVLGQVVKNRKNILASL
jgi:phosphatidylserine decarboxylase